MLKAGLGRGKARSEEDGCLLTFRAKPVHPNWCPWASGIVWVRGSRLARIGEEPAVMVMRLDPCSLSPVSTVVLSKKRKMQKLILLGSQLDFWVLCISLIPVVLEYCKFEQKRPRRF